ncbi:MAG: hypothetical protein KAR39_12780 [Thermoplasmata archaeon]|nr:hypothetical protein [Thermoplasmata archaeon]
MAGLIEVPGSVIMAFIILLFMFAMWFMQARFMRRLYDLYRARELELMVLRTRVEDVELLVYGEAKDWLGIDSGEWRT